MEIKKYLNVLRKYVLNPDYRFLINAGLGWYNSMPDNVFLERKFKILMGKDLNLENPQTFNEKLQWLKIYNRNPLYTKLVDKYEVRNYIAKTIGEEFLIPLLGVWDRFEDIDFDKLPNQFVLKCTHDSGSYIICKDKNSFPLQEAKKKLGTAIKKNFFYAAREWPYKNTFPQIIAEKYIEDSNGVLLDYKFFCFHGNVNSVMICLDRHIHNTKFYFFDRNWELQKLNIRGKNAPEGFTIPKPSRINEMFSIAERLSKDIPFVRVDLFECNGNIYFGEMTFFPDGGFDANLLPETDSYFGDSINLIKLKESK